MDCVLNTTRGVIPKLYIFKGERLHDNYIKNYKLGSYMAMQKKKNP